MSKVLKIPEKTKDVFSYNPDNGIVIREKSTSNRSNVGEVVGSINGHGYFQVSLDYKRYRLHRICWYLHYGTQPEVIDHINGIKTDNRITNLRDCSNAENARNSKICKINTSGFTGVSWHKTKNKWSAYIMVNGINKYLGAFNDKEKAINARKNAEKKYFGEYRYKTQNKLLQKGLIKI